MPYVVFQISVAIVVHNVHGDENHSLFVLLLQITHSSSEAKRRRWELARPCDMDMTVGEGRVCKEEREKVSHSGFGSTFVVDFGARHGITCHCCSQDSSIFSSSLTFEMDLDDSFIFSWILWNLGCKSTTNPSSSFSAFKKNTFKSCQGKRVSWPHLTPCHIK